MVAPVPSPSPSIKVGQVNDVQELRKEKPLIVPERYIREGIEKPTPATIASNIPVIDLSKLAQSNSEESLEEVKKLANACEEWGFFQIVNHGVDAELIETIEKVVLEFFMLPTEEKNKYPMAPGTFQGYGHAFIFSEEQKLDWCNMFGLGVQPHFLRVPKLWPTNPPKFSVTVDLYSLAIRKLSQQLLSYISMGLGLKAETLGDMFGECLQAMRMNYYPPCARPDLVLGLSSHSDGSAITVLQQTTGSVGLQILKDDSWVSVQPITNALVINIGDTLEVLTNGRWKSVEHRAVTNADKDRLAIVTFYAPSHNIELGPLPEFIDESHPCLFRRYNHGEYSQHYLTRKLDGKRCLDFVKIEA